MVVPAAVGLRAQYRDRVATIRAPSTRADAPGQWVFFRLSMGTTQRMRAPCVSLQPRLGVCAQGGGRQRCVLPTTCLQTVPAGGKT